MVVAHNLLASNSNRMLGLSTGSIAKSSEKLSSGYKINRAADDAAGLTISEKMRSQIRGLTQASANAQDGVSFVQTADGTLDEISVMLKRSKELAVKASTETLTAADRMAIQEEIDSISNEIDRVQQSSTFNDFRIFIKDGYAPSQADVMPDIAGSAAEQEVIPIEVTINMIDDSGTRVANVNGTPEGDGNNNYSGTKAEMAKYIKGAVNNAVSKLKSAYPNLWRDARTDGIQIGLDISNIDGPNNTLAYAKFSMKTRGDDISTGYQLRVDISDYDPDVLFGSTPNTALQSDLAATIAHEMTHLFMMDTVPKGMVSGQTTSLPDWFIEGTAQTSSGDGGWVRRGQSDSDLLSQIRDLKGNPYGAGYLATMYLGSLVGGSSSPADIKKGLDTVLNELAHGKTLDEVIAEKTSYSGQTDFENAFLYSNGSDAAFNFAKSLMSTIGSGAGSLLGDGLNKSQAEVFNAGSISGLSSSTAANYNLDIDHQMVTNAYKGTLMLIPAPDAYDDEKGRDITLQVGAANKVEQRITVKRFNISCDSLFEGHKMNMADVDSARSSLEYIDRADASVSRIRSYYGAIQNRLEHTIANLDNVVENTTAAESLIRDTDMAKEMVSYTKTNVLIQAGNAMLTQAMQTPQNVLQLLS